MTLRSKEREDFHFEISNACSCSSYDPETDEITPLDDCEGDCWEDQKMFFLEAIKPLWDSSEAASWWRVEGLPLWNRSLDGISRVREIDDVIRAMTVRGEWTLSGWLRDGYIEAILSHHDRPTGGRMTCRPVFDMEEE